MRRSSVTVSKSIIAITIMVTALSFTSCRTIENAEAEKTIIDQVAFSGADSNSDGKLSREELAAHLHTEALAEFDLNEDNYISNEEWSLAKPSAGDDDPFFNQLDKNSDGKVGQDEAVLYITEHVKFGDSFSELDKNGDFHLHWEEFTENEPASVNFVLFSIKE